MSDNLTYDGLEQSLGISFSEKPSPEEYSNAVLVIDEKKNNLRKSLLAEIDVNEIEYMEFEIKSSIAGLEDILNKLSQDIKIGSPPRMYEVYATLQSSKTTMIKELREIQKMLMDYKLKNKQIQTPTVNNTTNITMSSKALLEMITNAKENNSLNQIEAEFDIIDTADKLREKLDNA